MTRKRLCVIHNPTAGRGFSRLAWNRLRAELGVHADFQVSNAPEHAVQLAERAAHEGFATVAAAGGDGTVHEVANGLLRAAVPGVGFGVIPLGSGNDYARMLKLPRSSKALAELLLSDAQWRVDAGKVTATEGGEERYFVNTIGFGMSGRATWEARQIRGLKGVPLYGLAALKAIWRSFHAVPATLEFDGTPLEGPTLYLSVALGRSEGAGFVVAPDALLDDGWFDYLHAGKMSRLAALWHLPRLLAGKIAPGDGPIQCGRCQKVEICAAEDLMCHTDGELFSYPEKAVRKFQVELLPQALLLRAQPPNSLKN